MLAEKGAIAMKDCELFQFADTPEEAFALLKKGLTKHLEVHWPATPQETGGVPEEPAPSAEEILGPDIAKTRP